MASLEEEEGGNVERRGWWKSPPSKASASERLKRTLFCTLRP